MNILVIGAGAFGLGLSYRLNKNGNKVTLYSCVKSEIEALKNTRRNEHALPSFTLPKNITLSTDIKEAYKNVQLVVIAVGSKYVLDVSLLIKPFYNKEYIVIASKGICEKTHKFASRIIKEVLNTKKVCTISGPSFAKDLVNDSYVGLSVAASNNVTYKLVLKALKSDTLKLRRTKDFRGVELCGTMKNVLAIASGILEGLGVSDSTKAMFLTESLNDIRKFIKKMGGREKTILSFSGFGDIILSCTSPSSRNFTYGYMIGSGLDLSKLKEYLNNNTVEGVNTLKEINAIIHSKKIKYPFINILSNIVNNPTDPKILLEFLSTKK